LIFVIITSKKSLVTNIKWKYGWPYIVFITTIGILVLTNAKMIQNGIDANHTFAYTINIAGKQRMLSQKLVSNILIQTHY
jgi:nitrate/nitrite-specific signal transduction histidine kinase